MKRQRYIANIDEETFLGQDINKVWTWEEIEEYFYENYEGDECLYRYVEKTHQNEPYDYDTMYMTKEEYDEWVVEDAAYNFTYDAVSNCMNVIWV